MPNCKLRSAAVFFRLLFERLVGPSLFPELVGFDLSIELVKIAELLEHLIDFCHLQASLYPLGPASSFSFS